MIKERVSCSLPDYSKYVVFQFIKTGKLIREDISGDTVTRYYKVEGCKYPSFENDKPIFFTTYGLFRVIIKGTSVTIDEYQPVIDWKNMTNIDDEVMVTMLEQRRN